jgi:DNA-binding transcriptional LysR family regulator
VVAFTQSAPPVEAHHCWTEHLVWVRGPSTAYDAADPVPLVIHDQNCILSRLAIQTLDRVDRDWELVFNATSSVSVTAAVAAGLGISALVERFVPANLAIWSDPPLPALADIQCGIYLGDGRDRHLLEQLADAIADVIRPSATAALVGSAIERRAG